MDGVGAGFLNIFIRLNDEGLVGYSCWVLEIEYK